MRFPIIKPIFLNPWTDLLHKYNQILLIYSSLCHHVSVRKSVDWSVYVAQVHFICTLQLILNVYTYVSSFFANDLTSEFVQRSTFSKSLQVNGDNT